MNTRRGFTIVELVVVLGILALATAIAVPAFRALVVEDDMAAATRRVEALFRLARDSALRSGAPVTVVLDSVSGYVWFDTPAPAAADDVADEDPRREPAFDGAVSSSTLRSGWESTSGAAPSEPLELPPAVRLELTRARARFTIGPGGAAFADTLLLRGATQSRLVTLDPRTGDVVIR